MVADAHWTAAIVKLTVLGDSDQTTVFLESVLTRLTTPCSAAKMRLSPPHFCSRIPVSYPRLRKFILLASLFISTVCSAALSNNPFWAADDRNRFSDEHELD